jgi:hypothetical protein
MWIGEQERKQWREDLDPKIGIVRALDPTAAGHSALAEAWLDLVA